MTVILSDPRLQGPRTLIARTPAEAAAAAVAAQADDPIAARNAAARARAARARAQDLREQAVVREQFKARCAREMAAARRGQMQIGDVIGGVRPGEQRGFVHKKILGAVGAVGDFLPIPAFIPGIARRLAGSDQKRRGTDIKFAPFGGGGGPPQRTPCDFPMVRDSQGRCRKPTSGEFGGPQFEVGEAVMGRYGAALEPGSRIIDRAICLRGMQLGNDGLCYNKGQITNKQRMWPAGRKPLLSGGDMRCINIAARAGRRLEGATKRLQRLGMMKKPVRRALPPHRHAKEAAHVVSV